MSLEMGPALGDVAMNQKDASISVTKPGTFCIFQDDGYQFLSFFWHTDLGRLHRLDFKQHPSENFLLPLPPVTRPFSSSELAEHMHSWRSTFRSWACLGSKWWTFCIICQSLSQVDALLNPQTPWPNFWADPWLWAWLWLSDPTVDAQLISYNNLHKPMPGQLTAVWLLSLPNFLRPPHLCTVMLLLGIPLWLPWEDSCIFRSQLSDICFVSPFRLSFPTNRALLEPPHRGMSNELMSGAAIRSACRITK